LSHRFGTLGCMNVNLTRETVPEKADKFDCTCPREGPLALEERFHSIDCPAWRADWTRGKRLRYWLGGKMQFGGVTPYEGDDSQRALTSAEHFAEATRFPELLEREEPKPWYVRLQGRVRDEAYSHAFGRAPTWKHLGERLVTLVVEFAVRARRWLIWAAPFIAMAYIVFDIVRGS